MKSRAGSYNKDDEHIILKSAGLFALLLLAILFIFRPGQHTVSVDTQVEIPAPPALAPSGPKAAVLVAPREKPVYFSEAPAAPIPPAVPFTPVPTATPAGGGFRKIAFASNRADGRFYQLYMMDASGLNVERLTFSRAFDRDPHISYDGERIAFSSNRDKGVYQIFILDMDSRQVRQLTFSRDDKTNPFWSPDDRQILYTFLKSGTTQLGIMNADGSDAHQLTSSNANSHGYGFSPDGKTVSYESTVNNRNEVFVFDLGTHKPSLLIQTDDISYRGDPVYSPLGGKMVFSSDVLERRLRQLYIYDLNWKKYYRITDDDMDKDDPIFSPDGTKIAYVARWENAWNIFIMDADGKHAQNVTKSYYDNIVPSWR